MMEVANKRIEKQIGAKSQYQLHWLGRLRKENERHHFFRRKLRYRLCEQLCFQCSKRSLCWILTELAPKYAEKAYNDLDEAYIKGNLVNGNYMPFQ